MKPTTHFRFLRHTLLALFIITILGLMVPSTRAAAPAEKGIEASNGVHVSVEMIGPVTQTTDFFAASWTDTRLRNATNESFNRSDVGIRGRGDKYQKQQMSVGRKLSDLSCDHLKELAHTSSSGTFKIEARAVYIGGRNGAVTQASNLF